jgi:hypothetical protein
MERTMKNWRTRIDTPSLDQNLVRNVLLIVLVLALMVLAVVFGSPCDIVSPCDLFN